MGSSALRHPLRSKDSQLLHKPQESPDDIWINIHQTAASTYASIEMLSIRPDPMDEGFQQSRSGGTLPSNHSAICRIKAS
jgi:hypothetical protein